MKKKGEKTGNRFVSDSYGILAFSVFICGLLFL